MSEPSVFSNELAASLGHFTVGPAVPDTTRRGAMETSDKKLDQWAEQGGPPRLKAGLASLFSTLAISRAIDERILTAVRREAVGRNRMRWVIRYAIGSVAAAAAVI